MTRPAVLAVLLAVTLTGPAHGAEDMLTIPAGPFVMGRDDGPADERPAHTVTLPAYAIDRLPVTNAQFARFLEENGPQSTRGERLYDAEDPDARIHQRGGVWEPDSGYADHPVVEVSWAGAREYCAWVGKRLPSEAAGETAARGTDGRRYPWGNVPPDGTRAQYAAGWNETAPADRFPRGASPFGALDMAGNAWEWVSSAYRPYPYRAGDGREDLASGPVRGTRGGGHDSSAELITTTQRGRNLSRNPRSGHHNIGFRCAR